MRKSHKITELVKKNVLSIFLYHIHSTFSRRSRLKSVFHVIVLKKSEENLNVSYLQFMKNFTTSYKYLRSKRHEKRSIHIKT